MSGDGEWGYVVNMGSNTVTAINLTTNATTTINVGTQPINAVLNPAGTYMYLENIGSSVVSVIRLG
jgi:YVTN family beta-propeller protein